MSSTLGCYTCSELQLGRPCPSAATDRDTWRAGWPCTQSSISHITCFEFSIFIGVFCTYFLARNNNSFEEDNISSPSSWPPSKPSPASSWWRSPGSGNYEESSGGESEVCSIIVGSESPIPSKSVKYQIILDLSGIFIWTKHHRGKWVTNSFSECQLSKWNEHLGMAKF